MEVNNSIIENIVKNITKYIMISLFTVYIVIEIITITKFSFNYNYNFNYGNKLKSECKNKNIEFETERYQLYNNILSNIFENNTKKIYNYTIVLSVILIFAIIFGLLITYILYHYINDIINSDENNSTKFTILCYMMMILICGFSLIILPLFIGYNLDKNNSHKTNEFNNYIKYAEYGFAILLLVMIIIHVNTYNIAKNYSYTTNFIIALSVIFYLCIYLVKSIISYYKKKSVIVEYHFENIKSRDDYITNLLKNELNVNIKVLNDYMLKLFNIDFKNIDLNLYTSILIISLVLISLLMIFNRSKGLTKYINNEISFRELLDCLLYNKSRCEYFLFTFRESNIIYNFVILPIIFVILVIITINSTINYNEIINKNIILDPLIIYKTEINSVNNNFTNILDNDKISYKEKKSVDRNIANSILLVLYNEIFSDMIALSNEDKRDFKEFDNINILPKFNYIFNNKKEILNYQELDEYDIEKYFINKCGESIFVNTNLNSKCKENNKFMLYYILRSVFLYKPLSTISIEYINDHTNAEYNFYKNILKYKIYTALINFKNEKNYLGISKLSDNNYEKNCTLNVKFEHPKVTKEELLSLLGKLIHTESAIDKYKDIFENNINTKDTKEKIVETVDELLTREDLGEFKNQRTLIKSYIDLNINTSQAHKNILKDRIDTLELTNNIIKSHKTVIETIINKFVEYIIEVKTKYFFKFKGNTEEITISLDDLDNKFRKEIETVDDDLVSEFITIYKNIIKTTFNDINKELSDYSENNNDYHKQNNVSNYLLNNYYIANNKNIKTHIEKIDTNRYTNTRLDEPEIVEEPTTKIIKNIMNNIMCVLYYNHYFILEIKNKYSNSYVKSLIDNVKSIYDDRNENKKYVDLKKEYIIKINQLIIILNNTIYNKQMSGNIDKINKNIEDSNVNNYIVNEIVNFDNSNTYNKLQLHESIDYIKNFVENTQSIEPELHLISDDYINNIYGLQNKIDFFIYYIKESEIDTSKYNEKNKEFINNMLIEQKNLLEIISNADADNLNFNELLNEHNYINKFNKSIQDYNDYYNRLYNIKNQEIITENSNNNYKSTYSNKSNKEKSVIVHQNANISSNILLILLSIYLIIFYILIKLK